MPFTDADLVFRFDRVGNTPKFWRRKGTELLDASNALLQLWEETIEYDPPEGSRGWSCLDPALMLRAMGFECLLKACALGRQGVLARGGRYTRLRGVREHDLVGLAKHVALELSPQEERILRRLSRWITAGRYPIQREWRDQTELTDDGKVEFLCASWAPSWDIICHRLAKRILRRIPPAIEDGLDTFGRPLPPWLSKSRMSRQPRA